MVNLVLIAIGGFGGALSRYWLAKTINARWGRLLPTGTLTVNLIGSLALGLLSGWYSAGGIPANLKFIVAIGFLGAFTTFSTLAFESIKLIEDAERLRAGTYAGGRRAGGLAAVVTGYYLAFLAG